MIAFGYKGGVGTASRLLPSGETVGVLVLANFGVRHQLRVDGVRVGEILGGGDEEAESGSCIAVVATDASLSGHELGRVARRAGLGLARTGSVAHHGSGEIFVAFSTTTPAKPATGDILDEVFAATVEATEESVLNALWAAPDVQGRRGRRVSGLPHDEVLELLARHGRLGER
jgi:D-aminopeptidase